MLTGISIHFVSMRLEVYLSDKSHTFFSKTTRTKISLCSPDTQNLTLSIKNY